MRHQEGHLAHRIGWLRAMVLGANDGIISVSSLIVGVAAAPGSTASTVLVAGVAALVGGALAMAAGEYVSVSSQADTENADLASVRLNESGGDVEQRGLTAARRPDDRDKLLRTDVEVCRSHGLVKTTGRQSECNLDILQPNRGWSSLRWLLHPWRSFPILASRSLR